MRWLNPSRYSINDESVALQRDDNVEISLEQIAEMLWTKTRYCLETLATMGTKTRGRGICRAISIVIAHSGPHHRLGPNRRLVLNICVHDGCIGSTRSSLAI